MKDYEIVRLERSGREVTVRVCPVNKVFKLFKVVLNSSLWDNISSADIQELANPKEGDFDVKIIKLIGEFLIDGIDQITNVLPDFVEGITKEEFEQENLTLGDYVNLLLAIYTVNELGKQVQSLLPLLSQTKAMKTIRG